MTAAAKARPRAGARPARQSISKERLRLWVHLLRATRAIEAELRERLRVAIRDDVAAVRRDGGALPPGGRLCA